MKLLLYCTKTKPYLSLYKGFCRNDYVLDNEDRGGILNGKIVAECDFEVEEIQNKLTNNNSHLELFTNNLIEKELFEKSCLNRYEMFSYLKNNFTKKDEIKGYAIYLKNLHIFDKPNELFYYDGKTKEGDFYHLYRTPQNMMYVYDIDELKCILISIKPEHLCKILNGEQTILVRKKVLKEMLK